MGLSLGSDRKTDSGKASGSSLFEFLNKVSSRGFQVKSNFEVDFSSFYDIRFYCQSVTFPGIKTNNAELSYRARTVQIPINWEQNHEFQMTVLNDANGMVYRRMRHLMSVYYRESVFQRSLDSGHTMKVMQIGDGINNAGMNVIMSGVRLTGVSGMDNSYQASDLQTFTIDGYAAFTDFENGSIVA